MAVFFLFLLLLVPYPWGRIQPSFDTGRLQLKASGAFGLVNGGG